MAANKTRSRRGKTVKNGRGEKQTVYPRIIRLPLEGKIKRADIRRAVREVFAEKARERAEQEAGGKAAN